MGMDMLIVVIWGQKLASSLLFLIEFSVSLRGMATRLWFEPLVDLVDPVVS